MVFLPCSVRNRVYPWDPRLSSQDYNWLYTTVLFAMHINSRTLALDALKHLARGLGSSNPDMSRSAESKGAPEGTQAEARLYLVS